MGTVMLDTQKTALILLGNFWLDMIKSYDVNDEEMQTSIHAQLAEKLYKDLENEVRNEN
jgi:hypothetical protein